MKRLTLLLVLACALVPGTARANSGTFWDWLYGLDPKLTGIGTDIHLGCLAADGKFIEHCEEAWGMRPARSMRIADLKHEIDFRVAYFFEYGHSYPSKCGFDSRMEIHGNLQVPRGSAHLGRSRRWRDALLREGP